MRLLDDLNYYEILEISPDASLSEIRQARQNLLVLYQDDPIVADSFFSEGEKQEIISKIEAAFAVLSDPDKKAEYDNMLGPQRNARRRLHHQITAGGRQVGTVSPLLPDRRSPESARMIKKIEQTELSEKARQLAEAIGARQNISGKDIQALRRALNISVNHVFEVTRIREVIIRAIEADRFDELPPEVYLKSFLTTYARVLQISPEILAQGYLRHMAAVRNSGQ